MAEADFYEPIKRKLEEFLKAKGKHFYLELTAQTGVSERLKVAIPEHREIVFAFLRKRPDLLGYIEGQYSKDFLTVEIKERIELDDIYQAKLYKEVFAAKYGFLITTNPIPEGIKRLCKGCVDILHSAGDSTYRFLVIGRFDGESGQFVDWFEENPFEKEYYWK